MTNRATGLTFTSYQDKASTTAIYPDSMKVLYPAMGLPSEVGEMLNKLKKVFRDDEGVITADKRAELQDELGDVLWYIAQLSNDLDISMEFAAKTNLDKLASRQERNQLQGKGDNR